MTARDRARLDGCSRELIAKVERVLTAMADNDTPMMVTDGLRTEAQQWALWLKGRPWLDGGTRDRLVTYNDGVTKRSNHQSGRAADCCFVVDGKPSWDEHLPWGLFADIAEAEGLVSGHRWTHRDSPHLELHPDLPEGTLRA